MWLSFRNGTSLPRVFLDGREVGKVSEDGSVFLPAELFERGKELSLSVDCSDSGSELPQIRNAFGLTGDTDGLPDELKAIYAEVTAELGSERDSMRLAMLREIALSAEAAAERRRLPFDKHELRPMTPEKEEVILSAYDNAVRELNKGLAHRGAE